MSEARDDRPPFPSAGEALLAKPWMFLKSVTDLSDLPPATCPEIAFAGRSNVGKSSLLNAVLGRRGLARTSATPGRTRQLNYFTGPHQPLYLVDLPGYGFARAPKAEIAAWSSLLQGYLKGRPTLVRVFVLIDARHGLKPVDDEIMALLDQAAVSYQAVLTKSDKIAPPAARSVASAVAQALKAHPAAFPDVLVTSAKTELGIAELRAAIESIARENAFGSARQA